MSCESLCCSVSCHGFSAPYVGVCVAPGVSRAAAGTRVGAGVLPQQGLDMGR